MAYERVNNNVDFAFFMDETTILFAIDFQGFIWFFGINSLHIFVMRNRHKIMRKIELIHQIWGDMHADQFFQVFFQFKQNS